MQAVIFANGELCCSPADLEIDRTQLLIAADGGSQHLEALGALPDVLIGDLDSTTEQLLEDWKKRGVEIIRHPPDKDETDLELALLHAQHAGASRIIVYGAVGGRLDMTLANLHLLAHPALTVDLTYRCGHQEVRLLRPGGTLALHGKTGDRVSLIPLGGDTGGVITKNLAYPLQGDVLPFGFTRGISNRLKGDQAEITLEDGRLVVIHTRLDPEERDHA